MNFSYILDPFSFVIGFATASIFWWLIGRIRPLWKEIRQNMKEQSEAAQARRTSSVEENHRRITLRRAQGMHLAAPLFALDEIAQEPRLLAPPAHVEPGGPLATEDVITQILPYLPGWPELAAIYHSPTLALQQALSGGRNIVIIGQPGIGKTVALAYLASLAANRSEKLGELSEAVPFLAHVADLKLPVNDPKDILNPIIDFTSERAPVLDLGRLPSFIQHMFHNGRALLLLDGYDELTPEGQRTVSEYLKALLQAYPKARVVTSGCPEQLDGLIALGFAPLALAAWNKTRTTQFIRQWGELWTQFVAVEAWAQTGPEQVDPILLNTWLNTDHTILTPLELTLKVWGAYAGDSLGPHVLEAIASHVRRLAPSNTPLAALEMLAMQIVLTEQPIFDPRKARDWVRSFEPLEEKAAEEENEEEPAEQAQEQAQEERQGKEKPKKRKKSEVAPSPTPGLLGKIADSGLLLSHPHNRMRFAHPVIGGFLAGRALSGYKAEDTLLGQPDWVGKLLALHYLAAHGDVSSLADSLMKQSELPIQRGLLNTARWLRDAPREAAWRGKVLAALAKLMQTEGIPLGLRGQAMAAFVLSHDPGSAALFRQFMSSLSFELVRLAALGSGALHDIKAVDMLKNVLEAPSLSARRAACMALVAVDTNASLEVVARTLLSADEELRRAAAESLANDAGEGHAMLRDGATLSDILVRRAVVYGLARIEEPWATELLQKMQVEDDQWVVRNSSSEVLEARNQPDPHVPRSLKAPSESPWLIEFAGTQGVGISPGAPATDVLLAAFKSEKEEERLAALPYLKRTPSEGVIMQFYHAMFSDNPELREVIFQALWELDASGISLPLPSQFGLG